MTPEEYESINQALDLIKTVGEALRPESPLHEAFIQAELMRHKNIALQFLCISKDMTPLDIAKESFHMGYYLGLQYAKLEKMESGL
jgi:hypothetical protein